jgi:hypothetical protein
LKFYWFFFANCVANNGCGVNAIVVVISVVVVVVVVNVNGINVVISVIVVVAVVKTYRKYCSAELITVVFTGRDRLETTFGKKYFNKIYFTFQESISCFQ